MRKANEITVETGNIKVSNDSAALITGALGSCVAITLYDRKQKLGGMVHYILPLNPGGKKKAKYADTGIMLLLEKMMECNAKKKDIEAKMVGGAIMFEEFMDDIESSIGKRNIKKGKEVLKDLGIKLVSQDTGGNYGRLVRFQLSDGKVYINSYKAGAKII
ncbi:chemotaxis protein CheD [candidate division WOR-3 bacterium]|nr:chemotaxis protein CheD [candidate division WOR-3 bacterium]